MANYNVTKDDYQATFSTIHGQRVLAHLLVEYNFFNEVETEAEVAERNMLIRLLRNAGIIDIKNAELITRKLLEIGKITN